MATLAKYYCKESLSPSEESYMKSYNALKTARNDKAKEWIQENRANAEIMGDDEINELASKWYQGKNDDTEGYNGYSPEELLLQNKICIYIGKTKRLLHLEDMRWAIQRPNKKLGGRDIPVISKESGEMFTRTEMINILGAKSKIIFNNRLTYNARRFENACQLLIHHGGIPYRLHRGVSMGGMNDLDQSDENYLASIFEVRLNPTSEMWTDNLGQKFIKINNFTVRVNV